MTPPVQDTTPGGPSDLAAGGVEILPESFLREVVDTMVRLVEAAGAVVIFVGALVAMVGFVRALPRRDPDAFVPVRLTLGRFLALGLEFQLASDVLRTAIAPSFEALGKLAAVAAIRTALNYFLSREIQQEQRTMAARPTDSESRDALGGPGS
ncbi:DUF1622 domain-containing protein [Nocardioides malaquae]|nr:DUF1622 domain-containing protein [Nocardioides malaquae]